LMLWQFGHSQSLSRPAPAGFFWEPSSEYEPALVPFQVQEEMNTLRNGVDKL